MNVHPHHHLRARQSLQHHPPRRRRRRPLHRHHVLGCRRRVHDARARRRRAARRGVGGAGGVPVLALDARMAQAEPRPVPRVRAACAKTKGAGWVCRLIDLGGMAGRRRLQTIWAPSISDERPPREEPESQGRRAHRDCISIADLARLRA
ncbi:hypothetical protein FA95DRAFT_82803 [Auriscalpium vulgare]|uniref:Uncharacterized protein n=1 Tax=Auriscalpium vulgare TaxID=40419 RepID=A0ACB8RP82_9AGAM|nr:hypothetical protein FA95DRAFT_82803 [Auriscalpium vulgare]